MTNRESYSIGYFQGHYIVVDSKGTVIAHCDTYEECEQEIEEEEAKCSITEN